MQQYRYLCKKDTKVDPRRKLIIDLIEDVNLKQNMKSNIIILGDFNEDLSNNDTLGIQDLMKKTGLVQIFQELKNTITSTRGNNRGIDHIFASRPVLQFVTQAGTVPEEVCFASDHIGLFVDLSPRILDTNNQPIPPAPTRKLKMHNVPNVLKYVKAVVKQIHYHNFIKRLQNLDKHIKEDGFDEMAILELEKIDKHITTIMLKAENDLAKSTTHQDVSKSTHQ